MAPDARRHPPRGGVTRPTPANRVIPVFGRKVLPPRRGCLRAWRVISGLWRNDLLPRAKRLRFIQSIGAGTEQFSLEALKQHGVRLASARGVNARAVSEHVTALMLALARRLPEARDNQAKRVWRGMIGDLTQQEDELGGKTLLIVGLGPIGGRLAQLAKAFDMRVIGIRRDPRAGAAGHADAVHAMSELKACCRRPISLPSPAR